MSKEPLRIATLISGGGRTVQNLAECIERGEVAAEIVAVVSSRSDAYGVERARKLGLPAHVVARKAYDSPADFGAAVWPILRDAGAELVCLCGFLSKLPIAPDYAGRVINIPPALLPKYGGKGMYGHHVHEAVLAAGDAQTGCTIHYCDDEYDTGPIIVQRTCDVHDGDTPDALADRVFEQECVAYPEAIRMIIEGSVSFDRG